MGEAYALSKALNGLVSEDDLKNLRRKLDKGEEQGTKSKRSRQLLIGWGIFYWFIMQAWNIA